MKADRKTIHMVIGAGHGGGGGVDSGPFSISPVAGGVLLQRIGSGGGCGGGGRHALHQVVPDQLRHLCRVEQPMAKAHPSEFRMSEAHCADPGRRGSHYPVDPERHIENDLSHFPLQRDGVLRRLLACLSNFQEQFLRFFGRERSIVLESDRGV